MVLVIQNIKMKIKWSNYCFYICLVLCTACGVNKIYPKEYYSQNKAILYEIQKTFTAITKHKSIAIAFTDWQYDNVSIELKTDTVRYIFDFNYGEARIKDTLQKFGYNGALVQNMLANMKKIKCTWINSLDYYVDNKPNTLLFMAINAKRFAFNLKSTYYLFNFYEQPQYYDEEGRLLNKKTLRKLRKVNNEIFYRITDKVCYTISSKFR
jgi:hypothetical protein